ncbi:hypothetical protein COU24_01080 [Candidatus Kuenenbacteria bacterium CG10_big_fil_rev_8_21_14_0_10_39_14]|uniref:Uncharacterized protein n=3 Tax=Candidatus Kueneniibacteriota TaxID=1752740 RepID=A0A2M7MHU3_9BACT|nr:MAG: hypothetical protein COU24_01080 [Candidatus Kuenenbacteria bacterium CG10_big_fil_rev_8_21_14_0_10_39_14]PIX92607.1 MAG: hypothetical protein COZ26_00945 [Candidatus Kuenenbacteria bacterium CG_4_10_14_3_um_filter_39_14]
MDKNMINDNTKCSITNDIIKIAIKSTSEECELIRDDGQFFKAIAEALWIDEEDVREIINIDK